MRALVILQITNEIQFIRTFYRKNGLDILSAVVLNGLTILRRPRTRNRLPSVLQR
jgi:hypothetical protein